MPVVSEALMPDCEEALDPLLVPPDCARLLEPTLTQSRAASPTVTLLVLLIFMPYLPSSARWMVPMKSATEWAVICPLRGVRRHGRSIEVTFTRLACRRRPSPARHRLAMEPDTTPIAVTRRNGAFGVPTGQEVTRLTAGG